MRIISLQEKGSLIKPPISDHVRSGLVILNKGEEVGEHMTKENEECIIVIQGTATVILKDDIQRVNKEHFIYIPSNTIHNVRNNGDEVLKYVYVVA